jgi:uncharacterized protein GlcG (DUF336 family)
VRTITRAQALSLAQRAVAIATGGAGFGQDTGPIAVAVMLPQDGVTIPAVNIAMDGVKLPSVNVAANKAATVIAYKCNTVDLADYDAADTALAQGTFPQFNNWDGGIRVYVSGEFVAALAISGRTALGDRILAVRAAHDEGYDTDFGLDGLTDKERADKARVPGDL